MKSKAFFVFGVVFISLVIFLAGCKKTSTSPTPGTQYVLSMTALPSSIQKGDSSLVRVQVKDQSNQGVANLTVNFSVTPSTKGSFRTNFGTTDSTGTASSYFVSTDTGTVTLIGVQNSDSITTSLTITSTPTPGSTGRIASIEFSSTRAWIQVKGTGGIESAILVATGYDSLGNKVGAGKPIIFRILYGPGGGENLENKGYGPDSALTAGAGQATTTLNSGTVSGTVELRAESGTIYSNVTRVAIHAGPPKYLSLGADPLNIRGWHVINVTSDLLAAVVDTFGNPVENNTAVYFGTEEGMVDAYGLTRGGLAPSVYHTAEPFNDGRAFVWASTAGGTVADTNMIIVSGIADSVILSVVPESLLADGMSKSGVTVVVLDENGNYVVDKTPVSLETDFGTISSGATSDGVNMSLFETKLISQTLNQDYHWTVPDDGIGAIANVVAKSELGLDSVKVTFLTDLAYQKNCNLDIPGSVTYGTQAPINVVIKDRFGNPLGGHILEATVTQGTISRSPDTTNVFGESWKMVFTAPTDTTIKASTITVTDQDARGNWIILSKKVSLSVGLAKRK